MNHFPKIGLLITHYNRAKSLENLLKTFQSMNCTFGSIIVSDDGSRREHLDKVIDLQLKYSFQLICASENKGLGNNINKGQDAINTPFTLYIQEDFEPKAAFPEILKEAYDFMRQDNSLDIVRFYAYYPYPYLKYFNTHFSEMWIKPFATNYRKIYFYSDHPHLRRSSFFDKFGRYTEALKGDKTEYKMCISFLRNKGKGLFYNDCQDLFTQKNTNEEPSTMIRSNWRNNNNWFISSIRYIYRQIKYNYDIFHS